MDVHATITVGNFTADAQVVDCGPDALSDAMRQAISGALTLAGEAAIHVAVTGWPEDDKAAPESDGTPDGQP